MSEIEIFNQYKPFRNNFRKIALHDALSVIRAYEQFLQFGKSLPEDIDVNPIFINENKNGRLRILANWDLEILVREAIINSPESIVTNISLKKWVHLANLVNKLRDLEGAIAKEYDKSNIIYELYRISHRQFPWQADNPSVALITRYYKIFNSPYLDNIVKNKIGMSVKEIYIVGMLFIGFYMDKYLLFYPPKLQIDGVTQHSLKLFFNFCCLDIKEIRNILLKEQKINRDFLYHFNSLRAYPLIKIELAGRSGIICPIPTLLFYKLTKGLYYSIFSENKFDKYFGESFQNYVGDVIRQTLLQSKDLSYIEEQEYFTKKSQRKDTVDWVVYDNDAILFIECKTKRMTIEGQVATDVLGMNNDLDKMAEFIVQVYKNINDYMNNYYPKIKYNRDKHIFPIIITLEDWFIFGPKILEEINKKVIEKFINNKMSLDLLKNYPYATCSIGEFEHAIQIINKVGIKRFMTDKVFDKEMKYWNFSPYINHKFNSEAKDIKFLFSDDFKDIYKDFSKNV